MIRVILFVFAVGLILSFQARTTPPVAEEHIAQYESAQNLPGNAENQNDQQPSENEDSKEKENEDSDLKNYQSNRILEILNSSSGKILWTLLNENLTTTPYLQKINQPPESKTLA